MKLFVYGSFSEGMVHFSRLQKYVKSSHIGTIKGQVYALEVGFPAVVLGGNDEISGQLVELEAPPLFFKLLDEFHGFSPLNPEKSLYWRSPITVACNGEEQAAEVYSLNPAKLSKKAKLIPNGNWKEYLKNRPAVVSSLTSQQKEYVYKLGVSGGKEIIPIDIDIYRQLLKMDIIADKGRRLALTKFGKEVFRYLS